MDDVFVRQAAAYYAARLRQHGATPLGVDWNSAESQRLRFQRLLEITGKAPLDIVDYGCGYGALADFLAERGDPFSYVGYDASREMIDAARDRHAGDARSVFHTDRTQVDRRAFAVASGVFNVKQAARDAEWWSYVAGVLDDLASLGERGFAFNMLTRYSDRDRQRDDLYYASPEDVFRHCMERYSRSVALLHDYPLYEFTVLVTMEQPWPRS